MSVPNNVLETIERIASVARPDLTTHQGADKFTAQVAATLHFGSPRLMINPDPNWGRRQNPGGNLSDDVIQYQDGMQCFDIIQGAGAAGARIVFNTSTGGPWVAPESGDRVEPGNPGTGNGGIPPPPTGDNAAVLKAIGDLNGRIDTLTSAVTQLFQRPGVDAEDIKKFVDERMHQCINELTAVVNNATANIQTQAQQNEANDTRCVFRR